MPRRLCPSNQLQLSLAFFVVHKAGDGVQSRGTRLDALEVKLLHFVDEKSLVVRHEFPHAPNEITCIREMVDFSNIQAYAVVKQRNIYQFSH